GLADRLRRCLAVGARTSHLPLPSGVDVRGDGSVYGCSAGNFPDHHWASNARSDRLVVHLGKTLWVGMGDQLYLPLLYHWWTRPCRRVCSSDRAVRLSWSSTC